jgi:hypothetical protein
VSKERELLERVMYRIPSLVISEHDLDLVDDIKELLAQPEQEPVAWMYEWEEIGGKEWTSVKNGKYPPLVEEEYCMRNLRPLYLAPPKREPLSDYATYDMFRASKQAVIASCYWAGIRDAEKCHGIGGGDE